MLQKALASISLLTSSLRRSWTTTQPITCKASSCLHPSSPSQNTRRVGSSSQTRIPQMADSGDHEPAMNTPDDDGVPSTKRLGLDSRGGGGGVNSSARGGRGGRGRGDWHERQQQGREILRGSRDDAGSGGGGGWKGGREGGKAARGDGGRGGKSEPNEVSVSKALSKLLRHSALEAGLVLDGEGFANVEDVLNYPRLRTLNCTFSTLHHAVLTSSKQRFSLKPNPAIHPAPSPASTDPTHWLIRANQGHSIALDSAAHLTPITLVADNIPETVVHGTYFAFWESIVQSGGLKRMGRNHVHFGTGVPRGKRDGVGKEEAGEVVISGMRGDAEVLVYVDLRRCLEEGARERGEGSGDGNRDGKGDGEGEGLKWWLSENGVVLTEGDSKGLVPLRWFKRVVGRKEDIGVLVENGLVIGHLPVGVRGRKAPMGKGMSGQGGRGARVRGGEKGGNHRRDGGSVRGKEESRDGNGNKEAGVGNVEGERVEK